jgi:hypothetical protein
MDMPLARLGSNRAQLEDNLGAMRWAPSAAEVARLDAMMPPPRLYPQWFIAMHNEQR